MILGFFALSLSLSLSPFFFWCVFFLDIQEGVCVCKLFCLFVSFHDFSLLSSSGSPLPDFLGLDFIFFFFGLGAQIMADAGVRNSRSWGLPTYMPFETEEEEEEEEEEADGRHDVPVAVPTLVSQSPSLMSRRRPVFGSSFGDSSISTKQRMQSTTFVNKLQKVRDQVSVSPPIVLCYHSSSPRSRVMQLFIFLPSSTFLLALDFSI